MPGFRKRSGGVPGWLAWEGDPDDDAAHGTILDWLETAVTAALSRAKILYLIRSREISVSSSPTA